MLALPAERRDGHYLGRTGLGPFDCGRLDDAKRSRATRFGRGLRIQGIKHRLVRGALIRDVFVNTAPSENSTAGSFLGSFLEPLNSDEFDIGHCHPLGLQ